MILEEAAYCDEGFFYETVAPILSIGSASLVAISTLTSEINFYTRLIKMIDPATNRPLFVCRSIELACEKCKEEGRAHECVHLLHLVPRWQSEVRVFIRVLANGSILWVDRFLEYLQTLRAMLFCSSVFFQVDTHAYSIAQFLDIAHLLFVQSAVFPLH